MSDFCYWQAKSLQDCIIVYLNILMTLILTYFAIKYFKDTPYRLRRRVIAIYAGIWLWIVTNLTKDVYSVAIFHTYINDGIFNSTFSKVFAILDTPPAIVVQTLFLAIPYMMWKNVMRVLQKMNIERSIQEQQFLNFYTFYLTSRFVIIILPWIALIIIPQNHSSGANFAKLAMQLIDSFFCNILLLGSLTAFLKRFTQIKLDSQDDKKKLKWQYALMVICNTFRFIIDLGFLIILPVFSTSQCISPLSHHYYFSLGYTLVGAILMHFVPICIILYIYKPNQPVIEASETLSNNGND